MELTLALCIASTVLGTLAGVGVAYLWFSIPDVVASALDAELAEATEAVEAVERKCKSYVTELEELMDRNVRLVQRNAAERRRIERYTPVRNGEAAPQDSKQLEIERWLGEQGGSAA